MRGRGLKLTIPVAGDLTNMFGLTVTGNPPMKPTSEYTIIGKSFRQHRVTPREGLRARETWVTDVRLPDMLHRAGRPPEDPGIDITRSGGVEQ